MVRFEIIQKITGNKPVCVKESYFSKNHKEIYDKIIGHYDQSMVVMPILFKEKIWLWVNEQVDLPKCHCGNYTKFNSWKDGYRRNCSVKCSSIDPLRVENCKKSVFEKYGTESYFNSDDCKKKTVEKNLEKWGVEHYSKTDEYREKIRETNKSKWGVDHYSKTDEFRERIKETNLKNLGVENPFQSEVIKDKIREVNISKWGVDNYTKTDEYIERVKETNLDKWGSEWYTQTESWKEKTKETSLDKWGVDHYSKTDDFKKRVKETSLEKWGVTSYTKTDEYKNKTKLTNIQRWGDVSHTLNEVYRVENYGVAQNQNYIKHLGNGYNLFSCDCGFTHDFEILTTTYISRFTSGFPLCTICYPVGKNKSFMEQEVFDFISSNYSGEIVSGYRDGLEIDIYLPQLSLGFEFNGLWWHSDQRLDKDYHYDKMEYFNEKGIRIFSIWEDDWVNRKEILKSQIMNILNKTDKRIFARKCDVCEISVTDIRKFLDDNHIQGFVNSVVKLGLFYDGELVSVMSFDKFEGRKKMSDNEWNLNRFCNKLDHIVVGGASKLFSYFVNNWKPNRVISYADRDWSVGNMYTKLGFEIISEGKPDYKYLIGKKRIHKSKFRKSKLGLSESKEMEKRGIPKVWDCGKIKLEIKFN